jgi:hypothetical protein
MLMIALQNAARSIVPERYHERIPWGRIYRGLKRLFLGSVWVRKAWYYGSARYCPVCRSKVRHFKPHGHPQRPDAMCPVCYCLERHRAAWVFIEGQIGAFPADDGLLHFGPPWAVERRLRGRPLAYVTADLARPDVDVKLDITKLPFADKTFRAIICSHVLEHILDDRQAIKELSRVLDADGWALIIVPVAAGQTYEDAAVVEPAARRREFGQEDHVRRYGSDIAERLEAWFAVETVSEAEAIGNLDPVTTGVSESGLLFLCGKRQPASGDAAEPWRRLHPASAG